MAESRKTPKQKRGREAEKKIIKAAQDTFAKKGYAGTRVSDIVKLAESSTGSFYFRFKAKEALFDYMLDQYMEKCREAINELNFQTPNSIGELIYIVVCRNVELVEMNQGFYRVINEVSISNPQVWSRLQTLSQELSQAVVDYGRPFQDEVKAPDYEQAIRQATHLMSGWLANRASHSVSLQHFDEEALINMLYRSTMGVLQAYPVPDCANFRIRR
ncbi:MAG: TetR/AcrR family transcriptional regulator [Gammaproteobacteria bacterium]|nr:TetR/AcrR family transcriptional regulator [Gammaproteobacteria bacterium]